MVPSRLTGHACLSLRAISAVQLRAKLARYAATWPERRDTDCEVEVERSTLLCVRVLVDTVADSGMLARELRRAESYSHALAARYLRAYTRIASLPEGTAHAHLQIDDALHHAP
jgi:hypothetical protein